MVRRLVAVLSAVLCVALTSSGVAQAFGTTQPTPVSVSPSKATPNVLDGNVAAIAKVGSTVVLGGTFTKVANPGATTAVTNPAAGKYIAAFDSTTGQVNTAFAPGLDGEVMALLPGPAANTIYVGGSFANAGGGAAKNLVLLDLTTGKRVTTFAVPAMNGVVQALQRTGNRLFVGGTFTSLGGKPHGGLAAVNATTGVVDAFVQSTVAGHHNYVDGSPVCGINATSGCTAKAAVGVAAIDLTPDGSRMMIIGNFKTVDTLPRDQIAMFDLTGTRAVVRADWQTHGYEARCYDWAYDSYMRGVQFSPDGRYFAVVATGGGNGTMCDSVARFETDGSGTDIQPTWVDWAGGDSFLSVAVTGSAVYVGGHQRWLNNPYGNDRAMGGAVPRPGLGALDPATGVPLAWNPGRNPRGHGADALLATADGLYVGSDTDYIGNYQSKRMKVAEFPLASGTPVAATTTPDLPGNVYLGGAPAPAVDPSSILYRINAGGPALSSTDAGPDWAADTGSTPYRLGNSSWPQAWDGVSSIDSTVPPGAPEALFASERWDSGSKGDGDEMRWSFPVPAGQNVTVRLYLANQCTCTGSVGQRQFDVAVDGTTMLDHFDIVAAAGGTSVGTMRSLPIISDGSVDISFTHEVENPLINGIEIVKTPTATTGTSAGSLTSRFFDGSTASPAQPVASELDWNAVRAPVLIGKQLYYGKSDGTFYRRTFDGTTFGPEQVVDPYNDAAWSGVPSGSTYTDSSGTQQPIYYRGARPDFYGQLARMTSAFYSDNRLYYTLTGSSSLYYRAFSADSGIIYPIAATVPGVALPQVTGAFLGGGNMYFVNSGNGNLSRVAFAPGTVSSPATVGGSATVVSGPSVDSVDWRAGSLFLGPGGRPNAAPVATGTASCTGLTCTFDGTGSKDSDGSIAAYNWAFGDGATATGSTASHTYAAAGSYPAVLTVRDDQGATGAQQITVNPAPPAAQAVGFRGASAVNVVSAQATVTVPASVQPGDLLILNVAGAQATTQTPPSGWSQIASVAPTGVLTTVWQRAAATGDAGSKVTVTFGVQQKAAVSLFAYSGADLIDPAGVATKTDASAGGPHSQQGLTVSRAGSRMLWLWDVKASSGTTALSVPDGTVSRSASAGTGQGYLTTLAAESLQAVTGAVPGPSSTADGAAAGRTTMVALVIAPKA